VTLHQLRNCRDHQQVLDALVVASGARVVVVLVGVLVAVWAVL